MLIYPKSIAGVTLIELMIAVAILGILLVAGLPQASTWMQNTRIRTAAESMSNGLQLARAEAVRRNTQVVFFLTTDPPVSSAVTPIPTITNVNNVNWVVWDTASPAQIIQGAAESSPNVIVNSNAVAIVFTSLGRQQPGAAQGTIQVTNPTGGACVPAGPMRCLNIVVQIGGQIRMCDPSIATAGDTRKC